MPKAKSLKWWVMCLSIFIVSFAASAEAAIGDTLKGKILLQVEGKGEAWYVHPTTGERYYLGTPEEAFRLMKKLGLGISNANLEKIAIAEDSELPKDWDLKDLVKKLFKKKDAGAKEESAAPAVQETAAQKPQEEKSAKEKAVSQDEVNAKAVPKPAQNDETASGFIGNDFIMSAQLDSLARDLNIDTNLFKPLAILVGVMVLILAVFGRSGKSK